MKKMLILCDYYLPSVKAGGPLRSISAIIDCLKNTFEITVVTRNYDLGEKIPYKNITPQHFYDRTGYKIIYFSESEIINGIRELTTKNNFDIIYFNSFFSPKFTVRTLWALLRQKNHKTRVIISPRGELGLGALSIKKTRKNIFLFLFRLIFTKKNIEFLVSFESEALETKKAIGQSARVTCLSNITADKSVEKPANHKKENQLKIVFLSRICKKKNLHYAIETLSRVKGQVTLDIYGLIQEPDYWQACLNAIEKLPKNIRVNYCGECDPSAVLDTLKNYDLFFLPTLNENYGYAIVESLAAGVPVLLSDQTPWYDLSAHDAGWEFSLEKPEAFAEKIDALILQNNNDYLRYKNAALNYYLKNVIDRELKNKYIEYFTA